MSWRHEKNGLSKGIINSVHSRADCSGKVSGYVHILGLVCINADLSKYILNLDIVFDYPSNFGYFLPFFWVLNVLEIDLAIKLPHARLKGAQDALFHRFLYLQVNFEDVRKVLEFLDLLRDLI